jgi:hypothetical protein
VKRKKEYRRGLPELQAKVRAINAQLIETEIVGGDTILVSPVTERITRPTLTGEGRKGARPAVRRPSSQSLADAIDAMQFMVTGITRKTLRGLMTGLQHRIYSTNQASYELPCLARNSLIRRVPGRNGRTLA